MTKADIAALVMEKGLTRKQAVQVIEAMIRFIKEALQRGEKVQLMNFGSFQVKAKRARRGRNPQTGEEITIAPRKVLKFKPGKALYERLNAGS